MIGLSGCCEEAELYDNTKSRELPNVIKLMIKKLDWEL